jgi:hypothetical protein
LFENRVLRRELFAGRAGESGELLQGSGGAGQGDQPGSRRSAFRFDRDDASSRRDNRNIALAEYRRCSWVFATRPACFVSPALFPSNLNRP